MHVQAASPEKTARKVGGIDNAGSDFRELLTTGELCQRLRCSRTTLHVWKHKFKDTPAPIKIGNASRHSWPRWAAWLAARDPVAA